MKHLKRLDTATLLTRQVKRHEPSQPRVWEHGSLLSLTGLQIGHGCHGECEDDTSLEIEGLKRASPPNLTDMCCSCCVQLRSIILEVLEP